VSLTASIYVGTICLLGLALLVRTWLWLRTSHRLRRRKLEIRKKIDPINTQSPVGNPAQLTTEIGLESIQRQFTVHQLLLIPMIILLTALAVAVPFLGAMPATFISLVAAAMTVILGVAARPFIENAIAGLTIAFSRLVSIGDTVKINEHYGTIEDITATHTTIKIWDWRRYVVPNNRMLNESLVNYTLNDSFIWVHVEFHVAHSADIDQVRDIAILAPQSSKCYRDYEEPRFWVMELGKEQIRCWVAAWSDNAPEAWQLSHDTRTELIRQLRKHGIESHVHRLDISGPPAKA
jgi:small-conductance mechanosensitive channel